MMALVANETPLPHKIAHLVPLAAAVRLCESLGFTECGAVLDDPEAGYSRFFEKKLSA
ncbi:hypothetical protein IMCC20628_02298 [Hoeflea sp. IMCC20628]|uniref:hypothetical protein n=1 Tax=Hoeflea sp. IMCC20628 TaxID=1620421 RepID=UPI00063BDC36|nr:hypothetical protein [Hoeflea sp. IMCC20628]AKI00997.1 hypothetical protein IMCC20628_02298 [Hoeflea sp. IMCC20628]